MQLTRAPATKYWRNSTSGLPLRAKDKLEPLSRGRQAPETWCKESRRQTTLWWGLPAVHQRLGHRLGQILRLRVTACIRRHRWPFAETDLIVEYAPGPGYCPMALPLEASPMGHGDRPALRLGPLHFALGTLEGTHGRQLQNRRALTLK